MTQFYIQGEIKGNFSVLSNTLSASTAYGFFDGTCARISG